MSTQEGQADDRFMADMHRVFARVLGLAMATVAAVNGHAFAAGAMLTVAHDHRVMRADRGYWCLNEVDLGLPLTPGMQALLSARLPSMTAHRAIVTGHRFTAPEAQAAGIIDEVAEEAEVVGRAVHVAGALAAKRAEIMGTLKRGLHGGCIDLLAAGGQHPR
jgi:Delta3-Delta2-enoyl-CoA isomerase